MSLSLQELCSLVAETGITKADMLTSKFEQLLDEESDLIIDDDVHITIFLSFTFMNWMLANGVWSNLNNASLRRDLMSESKSAFILRVASELCPSESPSATAAFAVSIDQELQSFARAYIEYSNPLAEDGVLPDARVCLQFALERIQRKVHFDDLVMTNIVYRFAAEAGDFAEVEIIASQVNRAADNRKKKDS